MKYLLLFLLVCPVFGQDTPTHTPFPTRTFTNTFTPTVTSTSSVFTSTNTYTNTWTYTFTPTITLTPTATVFLTYTKSWTPKYTNTVTNTFTPTPTPTITNTPSYTYTPTQTSVPMSNVSVSGGPVSVWMLNGSGVVDVMSTATPYFGTPVAYTDSKIKLSGTPGVVVVDTPGAAAHTVTDLKVPGNLFVDTIYSHDGFKTYITKTLTDIYIGSLSTSTIFQGGPLQLEGNAGTTISVSNEMDMFGYGIHDVPTPASTYDVANKSYVDSVTVNGDTAIYTSDGVTFLYIMGGIAVTNR